MANVMLRIGDREALATRIAQARTRTDQVFSLLRPDALYERPIPERHRLIFYLGHIEAFDWNLIPGRTFGVPSSNESFDRLFAFGIDPTNGNLPGEAASAWPGREAVDLYNRRAREAVDLCLSGEHRRRADHDELLVFNMAIEHRLMHAETLVYLLNQLPYEMKSAPPLASLPRRAENPAQHGVSIPAGTATLGRSRTSEGYGWDNEFGEHVVEVPAFSIDAHKTTNGRYLEFIQEGGYRTRSLWTDAAWEWRERRDMRHPIFWRERDGQWFCRGVFAEAPLNLDAPVYVSHAEACAFARWTGGLLPTEAQFHRAAHGTPGGDEREYPWGQDAPDERHGNFDLHRWDPAPIGGYPDGDSAFGVSELVGNGWEWTSSVFGPFGGFRPHPLYTGYSADFFDGRHFVLKGGSPRTDACMLRRSFRNWFQPHYPYVYATFRLVRP